ncbi:MAG TPA: LysR family transcriptional regulator [Pseudolabrys sp.]|nr:LysR family transcriptional regulator [Pseudolabrys sp.]
MQPAQVSRRLKLRQLDTLLAVAQSGSMAKAAESLSVTQPVVSKSIADLEATLGVRLFDRTTQGVEPTLYGRALVERSVAIFNDLRTSVTELQFLSDSTAGELRIGSSETLSVGMLGVILDRLSRSYPRLSFGVVLGGGSTNPLPLDDLRARNIDLIIGRLPNATPEDIETISLYEDISRVVAGANNQFTRRRRVQISELINEPWCGTPFDSFPFSVVADACRAAGLPVPHQVVMARSLGIRNSLLASGRFLTVYPTSVLHFAGKDLSLKRVPINLPSKPYPIGIVTLKNRTLNPAARRFIDCAREVAADFTRRRPLEADSP